MFAGWCWSCASPVDRRQIPFQQLYDERRWFDLRDTVEGQRLPTLHRGAVASAFNRVEEAERQLNLAIRESSDQTTAAAAQEALATLYMRIGRFSDALRLFDEVLTRLPERADIRNVRTLLAPLRGISSDHVQSTMRSTFACGTGPTGVRLPLSVNGKPVSWLLDIAFTMPAVSEAEASCSAFGLRVPLASRPTVREGRQRFGRLW
jgi:tetratricopeptide (TPR) repeat protein